MTFAIIFGFVVVGWLHGYGVGLFVGKTRERERIWGRKEKP